jgi:hypothetical protein
MNPTPISAEFSYWEVEETRDQSSDRKWITQGNKLVCLSYIDFVKSMVELPSNWARSRASYILGSKYENCCGPQASVRRPFRSSYILDSNNEDSCGSQASVSGPFQSSYILDSKYEDRCGPQASVRGPFQSSYISDSKYEDRCGPQASPLIASTLLVIN